jgi:adenylate cyclase
MGEQQVKNIARPVHVFRIGARASRPHAAGTAAVQAPLPLPDKPSLAVLPFQNMSGDPEQEYFADGMVEEITTAIARLPWLFVIARNSSFTYKGKAVDVKQVARELGVRYVLEGSVRKAANRVRITGQLIDTATGAHIWADRFDGALDDIFELQDQVASSVAGAIEPRLRQSEIERASRKPTESLDAYDLYLRALAIFYKADANGGAPAIALLREALAIDPGYAPAAGLIGIMRVFQNVQGIPLSPEDIAETLSLARRAIGAGGDDPEALANGAWALALLGGEHAAAMRAVERALALNPNCAHAWHTSGAVHAFANRPDAAIAAVQQAMRLSPLDPLSPNFHWIMGYALMQAGRYEEALEWVDRSLHDRPSNHAAIRGRVARCAAISAAPMRRASGLPGCSRSIRYTRSRGSGRSAPSSSLPAPSLSGKKASAGRGWRRNDRRSARRDRFRLKSRGAMNFFGACALREYTRRTGTASEPGPLTGGRQAAIFTNHRAAPPTAHTGEGRCPLRGWVPAFAGMDGISCCSRSPRQCRIQIA